MCFQRGGSIWRAAGQGSSQVQNMDTFKNWPSDSIQGIPGLSYKPLTAISEPHPWHLHPPRYPEREPHQWDGALMRKRHRTCMLRGWLNKDAIFRSEQCGFFINPLYPFFRASPDGMRHCACHGCGCVEVKCPATKASLTIDENCQDPTFCLEKIGDKIKLKTTQQYYKQVQMQIFVTNADFCDFVMWTTKDMFVQRSEPDFDFWQEMVPKMQHCWGGHFARTCWPVVFKATATSATGITQEGEPWRVSAFQFMLFHSEASRQGDRWC